MIRKSRSFPQRLLVHGVLAGSSQSRLRNLAFTSQLVRIMRLLGPTLLALSFAGVAHAQGTTDFTGAQTLMTTFNVGPAPIQSQIEIPDCFEIVAEQPMGSFKRQGTGVDDFEQCLESRVIVGSR